MTTIFLSYARDDDEDFVRRLYDDLTTAGFGVWFDRVSMPSRALTFLQEIRDAISAWDRLVLVVGPDALASEYVEAEWRWAFDFGKPVNPVLRLGDYDTLPEELKLLDAPDFRDDAHYQERLATLIRQLSEPVPPMGKLAGVPSLPQHLLKRADRLRALKDAVLADIRRTAVVTGEPHRVGVQGMGGIGKSVLATMLARDTEVRRAFPDGVIWVPVGQTPNLAELQRSVAKALGDLGIFDNVGEGKAKLQELLADRAVLLMLDDVWDAVHAEAFDCLGPRCRMVITSRDAGIITALGGTEYQVQLLTEAEARDLLAEWAGLEVAALPAQAAAVMAHCGRLPLALSLCGAMVRDGAGWDDLLEALAEADLEYLDHPHGSILRSIKVSVDRLEPDEAARFAELRVFQPDATAPEAAVATLWAHTGGLSDRHARKLLTKLETKALIRLDGVSPNRQVSLHDLVYDYTGGVIPDEPALHGQLLEAYRQRCPDGWASGPNDGYFLQRLVHHLIEAGQQDELLPLLTGYRFLDAKLRGVGVQSMIEDYERAGAGEVDLEEEQARALSLIGGALRLSAHVLAQDPDQLPSQLFGRLVGFPAPSIQALLSAARGSTDRPWLRPTTLSLVPPGGPMLRTLTGHDRCINSVGLTPDGRQAVSVGGTGGHGGPPDVLRVWDLCTGAELLTFTGHCDEARTVLVMPDGRHAISGGGTQNRSGELILWNLATGAQERTLTGHTDRVNAVAVTPDGLMAVTASQDKTLKVWDLERGAELRTLTGHSAWVEAVTVTADGCQAVSASYDNTLKVWDLKTGDELLTFTGHTGAAQAVAVTPDGRRVISASGDDSLKVWDIETGRDLLTLTGHGRGGRGFGVTAVAVTPDGRRAISVSDDQTLRVWDLDSGEELRAYSGHSDSAWSVAVTPDGCRVVTASWDGTLKVWDLQAPAAPSALTKHGMAVKAVAVTADGRKAISASDDRTLKVWDIESGAELRTFTGHSAQVNAMAVTADGRRVVSGSSDAILKVWDLEDGTELATFRENHEQRAAPWRVYSYASGQALYTSGGGGASVTAVALTVDGHRVISAHPHQVIRVWDLAQGTELANLIGHDYAVQGIVASPDGRRVISASTDRTLKVWDIDSGAVLHTLRGHAGAVNAVMAMPDGRRVMSGSSDGAVKMWDLDSGREVLTLFEGAAPVISVSAAPDGSWMAHASAAPENELRAWDSATGELMCRFSGDGESTACAVTPDGSTIVAGDRMGYMHFLRLEGVTNGPPLVSEAKADDESYAAVLRRSLALLRDDGDAGGVLAHLAALSALPQRLQASDEVGAPWCEFAATGAEIRSQALCCYGRGDYAAAEERLRELLGGQFGVAESHCNLACVYLAAGRNAEAEVELAQGVEHLAEMSVQVYTRVVLLRIAFSLLRGELAGELVATLKATKGVENASLSWPMDPVLEQLRTQLSLHDHTFLTSLDAALRDRANVPALDSFAAWRRANSSGPAGGTAAASPAGVDRQLDQYKAAASAEAARLNLEYQRDLSVWRGLPWWRRLTRKPPVPPEGI